MRYEQQFNFLGWAKTSMSLRVWKVTKHTRHRPMPLFLVNFVKIVPRYLLFYLEKDGRGICQPMFEKILPNIKSFNVTDAALIQSLFGYRLNPVFLSVSIRNELMPKMRGKFCSNASGEWALFTTFENSQLH